MGNQMINQVTNIPTMQPSPSFPQEDSMILNNRKHSQTNLINVNPNTNDPNYRLKIYKSQNKFNLTSTTSEPFMQRNEPQLKQPNSSVQGNHNVNYQKIYNNQRVNDMSVNEKSKFMLNSSNKDKPINDSGLGVSNFILDAESQSIISINIKLKEGLCQVIEVKKADNVNYLVKNFCENHGLGEVLIKPITNKIIQSLEFMNTMPKMTVPSSFEELLKEAFEFYSQQEKWDSVFDDDYMNVRTNIHEPVMNKKRNNSA
jgi:hypothetical protein